MTVLAVTVLSVLLIDHAIKLWVRARAGGRPLRLGALGEIRAVPAQIWIVRAAPGLTPRTRWTIWTVAAIASGAASAMVPALAWAFGLLVGGALSHAIELSLRGSICDHICLRFWPAFEFADVAITAGAAGLIVQLATVAI